MYGIINQAVKDLVTHDHGESKWIEICNEAKVDSTDFISLDYYPDHITYALVGATSKVLSVPAPDVLKLFGKYWILYTAKQGYGPIMNMFGENFTECLKNLDNLHSRMGMTMPNLTPPKFILREKTDQLIKLEYQSKRPGLCPMVAGLLEGLAEKHHTKVSIEFTESAETKMFHIHLLGATDE